MGSKLLFSSIRLYNINVFLEMDASTVILTEQLIR